MELISANKFDEQITDTQFLLYVGKHLENLIYYKELLPMSRALIPINHELYGINVYHDGSINTESITTYFLTVKSDNETDNVPLDRNPKNVPDVQNWLDSGSQLSETIINPTDDKGTPIFSWKSSSRCGPQFQKHNLIESRVATFKKFAHKIFKIKYVRVGNLQN